MSLNRIANSDEETQTSPTCGRYACGKNNDIIINHSVTFTVVTFPMATGSKRPTLETFYAEVNNLCSADLPNDIHLGRGHVNLP